MEHLVRKIQYKRDGETREGWFTRRPDAPHPIQAAGWVGPFDTEEEADRWEPAQGQIIDAEWVPNADPSNAPAVA